MRAINHALTGAIIGLNVSNPPLAIGLSVLSHYVCDAIPHYGDGKEGDQALLSKAFVASLWADALLCGLLVLVLAWQGPTNWLLAAACAFAAAAPDFASISGFLRVKRGQPFVTKTTGWYIRFAKKIQWFERPSGAIVEVVWFVAGTAILLTYL